MKTFLCTVLLVVGLASVSFAQQKVMTISAVGYMANNYKLIVNVPGQPTVQFDLPSYSNTNNFSETHRIIADKLQEYLNKGWRMHSQSSTGGTFLSISYTLVKDE